MHKKVSFADGNKMSNCRYLLKHNQHDGLDAVLEVDGK